MYMNKLYSIVTCCIIYVSKHMDLVYCALHDITANAFVLQNCFTNFKFTHIMGPVFSLKYFANMFIHFSEILAGFIKIYLEAEMNYL